MQALNADDIVDLTKRRPETIARFAETGVRIERQAHGEPTERMENKTTLIDEAVAAQRFLRRMKDSRVAGVDSPAEPLRNGGEGAAP